MYVRRSDNSKKIREAKNFPYFYEMFKIYLQHLQFLIAA